MSTGTDSLLNSPLQLWMTQDDCQIDFSARLVRETALPSDDDTSIDLDRWMTDRARSHHASTRVHPQSEYDLDSMASDNVPALTRGNSVASSSSDTSSDDNNSVIDGGYTLDIDNGVLARPPGHEPNADLLCPFQILDCAATFSNIVEFKDHVFSHFKGYPLPPYAPCFVCSHIFFQRPQDDHALSWNNLLSHMAYDHYRAGIRTFIIKPDIAVMRYMWDRRIISDAEFKRTQLIASPVQFPITIPSNNHHRFRLMPEVPIAPPASTPPEIRQHMNQSVGSQLEPYTVMASRRQDRRQMSQQRLIARVRG